MTVLAPSGGDDSPAFAAAFAAFGGTGGIVETIPGGKYLIDTDLTVPKGCAIRGPFILPGDREIFVDPVGPFGSIAVNPAASIYLEDCAGLSGLILHRKDQQFMEPDCSLFAGTAVKIIGTDCFVERSCIYGFEKAILSDGTVHPVGYHRQRIKDLYLDNINGIEIAKCADICYVENCHAFPFSTRGANGGYKREGTAYLFRDKCDWGKVSNCFAFGYLTAFRCRNANSMTFLSCSADNTKTDGAPDNAGSRAFVIDGTSTEVRLIGTQSAAMKQAGVEIDVTPGNVVHVTNHTAWRSNGHGVLVRNGDAVLMAVNIREVSNGLTSTMAASRIVRSCTRWRSVPAPVNNLGGATMIASCDDIR